MGALAGAHARRIISADGKLVTPGFIDIHRHADLAAWRPGFGQPELRQGLTTIVNGNCGLSAAPMRRAKRAEIAAYLQPICGEMPKQVPTDSPGGLFLPASPRHPFTGMLVGAGVLRASAAGYALEHLEDRHYKTIHRAMEQALADGALGVSLGLGYAPGALHHTGADSGVGASDGAEHPRDSAYAPGGRRRAGGSGGDARRGPGPAHTRSHQPPEGHGPGQLGREDPPGPGHAGEGPAGGPGGGLRCVPLHCRLHPAHPHPAPGFSHRRHRGGGAAAAGQGGSAGAGERIRRGDGFDDIAKLAGWDGIRLTSLHCPEDHPYQGRASRRLPPCGGRIPWTAAATCWCGSTARSPWWTSWPRRRTS